MISRATVTWLICWLLLTAGVYCDAQFQRGPCAFSLANLPRVQAASRQDADVAPDVAFDPCMMWRETLWWEKMLVFSWLFAGIGLLHSFIRDIVHWMKRRRGMGANVE